MASDKQNEGKIVPMDENKENAAEDGIGLESILSKAIQLTRDQYLI